MKTSAKKTINPQKPLKLSVIIVTHNNQELVLKLLSSLKEAAQNCPLAIETIIVDNASQDETVKLVRHSYPSVRLIQNPENFGFAVANNIGIRTSGGEFILLLNSDTLLHAYSLQKTIAYLNDHKEVGVLTCKVVLEDGKLDPACHRGFPTPWASLTYLLGLETIFPHIKLFSGYHKWYQDLNSTHEIDSPSGAFYLTKKKVLQEVGLLDEDFFMYGEDLDLSFRIKQAGWKIVYFPFAHVTHLKNRSGILSQSQEIKLRTLNSFYDSMLIFYHKHYKKSYPRAINYIVSITVALLKTYTQLRLKILWMFQLS